MIDVIVAGETADSSSWRQHACLQYLSGIRQTAYVCDWNRLGEAPAMMISLKWHGGLRVRTMAVVKDAAIRGAKIVVHAPTWKDLDAWSAWFKTECIRHVLVSPFRMPWHFWKAPWVCHDHFYHRPLVQFDATLHLRQPEHPVAYFGDATAGREKMLKKIQYKAMIRATEDDYRKYGLLCHSAAYHAVVSDPKTAVCRKASSRLLEAWLAGRPCIFHPSFVKAWERSPTPEEPRRKVPWDSAWTFSSIADLHDKCHRHLNKLGQYDLRALQAMADQQRSVLSPYLFMSPEPRGGQYLSGEL